MKQLLPVVLIRPRTNFRPHLGSLNGEGRDVTVKFNALTKNKLQFIYTTGKGFEVNVEDLIEVLKRMEVKG